MVNHIVLIKIFSAIFACPVKFEDHLTGAISACPMKSLLHLFHRGSELMLYFIKKRGNNE
jgi:hypothetical protein